MSEVIKIVVAPGIGDIFWELMTLDKSKTYEVEICKSNINRGKQILDLMPKTFISKSYYSKSKKYPKDCTNPVNEHLEAGKRIEEHTGICNWDLEFKNVRESLPFKKSKDAVYFGIYTSAVKNNKAWKGWTSPSQWQQFMNLIRKEIPNVKFVGIGAEYDDLMDSLEFDYTLRDEKLGLVVKTMKNLDYMFGFPSGIPILADYLGVKTFMFFPDKLDKLQNTFTKKERIGKEWKGCRFTTPEKAVSWIKDNWL